LLDGNEDKKKWKEYAQKVETEAYLIPKSSSFKFYIHEYARLIEAGNNDHSNNHSFFQFYKPKKQKIAILEY